MLLPYLKMDDYESSSEYEAEYDNAEIHSYTDFLRRGKKWVWCLVGNIVEEHDYGEEHETRSGSKQFRPGAKVFCAPGQWGDGYENIVVLGVPRYKKGYIEVIIKRKLVCNFRMQQVFKPAVLKRMCDSEREWWNDNENTRLEIISYLEYFAPEEAEKEKKRL